MTTGKLKELMRQYCIIEGELDDVIAFVTDLLYLRRKDLEEKEPYAIRTINAIYGAEILVDDLNRYISELEEE